MNDLDVLRQLGLSDELIDALEKGAVPLRDTAARFPEIDEPIRAEMVVVDSFLSDFLDDQEIGVGTFLSE